jgi:hypothetical protein
MKIQVRFNGSTGGQLGQKDIYKPTIGNESLQEISNDNGVRAVMNEFIYSLGQ